MIKKIEKLFGAVRILPHFIILKYYTDLMALQYIKNIKNYSRNLHYW